MSARFRIRTPMGQELSFGSEEMFADFVRSGELSPGDLVYDAETGEWSPAMTHSLVLELTPDRPDADGTVGGSEQASPSSEPDAGSGTAGSPGRGEAGGGADPAPGSEAGEDEAQATEDGPSGTTAPEPLSLELAPERTPEEAAAAFVAEMMAEREQDLERDASVAGLQADESGTGLLRPVEDTPAPPSEEGSGREAPPDVSGASRAQEARQAPGAPLRTRGTGAASGRPGAPAGRSRGLPAWAWVAAVLVAVVLLGPELVGLAMGPPEGEAPAELEGEPLIPDTEEALRARARVGFLARARSRLSGLPPVPDIWLDGRYLANASQYPQVREVWATYLERTRELRADEDELFSQAYLGALDDARVTGSTRTLRLAAAISGFEAQRDVRERHYRRALDLAATAIRLHDVLLDIEDDVSYEPAVGQRLSTDPVLQAAGRTPEVQSRLEAALDDVLDRISAGGEGPVEARAVPSWLFEGLRAAVEAGR